MLLQLVIAYNFLVVILYIRRLLCLFIIAEIFTYRPHDIDSLYLPILSPTRVIQFPPPPPHLVIRDFTEIKVEGLLIM
jgi:hypothetical protein